MNDRPQADSQDPPSSGKEKSPDPDQEQLRELRAHSSRRRYEVFRRAFVEGRLHQLAGNPQAWKEDDRGASADPPDPWWRRFWPWASKRPEDSEAGDRESKKTKRSKLLGDYRRWLAPHRRTIIGLLLLSLAGAVMEMAHPLFMKFIVDQALLGRLSNDAKLSLLHAAGGVFLGVILLGQGVNLWKNYLQRLLNTRVILSLRRAMFEKLVHLPLSDLSDMKTGGVISRLTGDVNTTTGLLQLAVISPGVSAIRLLLALGVLFALNWRLAFTAMAVLPCVMAVSFFVARRVRPVYRAIREDNSDVDSRVGETFGGVRVVRSFQRESRESADYVVGRDLIERKALFAHRRELVLWTGWGLLMGLISLVIVWYGGSLFISGRASIGDIMAFQWYTFLLLNPVWQIVNSFSELQRSLAATERVFEVLRMDSDKPDRPEAIDAPRHVERVRFENVSFAYHDEDYVVENFDVDVPGGSVVALVGRSGAGKTTVTDLVARFHDPSQGRLLVNGRDVRDYRLRSYRSLLGVVQQEVFLFDGTVAENIAYGRPQADLEEVMDAARRANAHEFIRDLPQGYDSIIGERGVKLSGGQRQRISIARAILADPRILILDEATSNLDSESEQLIQASLDELLRDRTTFMIAHRLSTIMHADLILVMDQGKIVEQGSHDELMQMQGAYAEMTARQAGLLATDRSSGAT